MQVSKMLMWDEALIHQPHCETLREAPPPAASATEGIETNRDELIRYAVAMRPCYDRINRVIGQLAGLFILAHAMGRVETDFEAMRAVLRQMAEVREAVNAISPPPNARRHYVRMLKVQRLIDEVALDFRRPGWTRERTHEALARWNDALKSAHAHLRAASSGQLGMLPVDFGQACCSCHGPKVPPRDTADLA
ncbi:hypothetical protein [Xylophilus sp. ASV27]|uniref:hypothetical protein n=1 Tax=Xylophilus sp. ASV27 TaxID=2795129 RepID=UPI0018EA989D|nr:hypothetical protein [Xylophilus sp. ASV27]